MSNWGSLGSITFRPMQGPLDESWKAAVEVAEQARLGRKPVLSVASLKAEELNLRVRLDAQLGASPEQDIAAFRQSMESGEVLPLVLGSGDSGHYAEAWLLAGLDVAAVERLPGGRIHSLEVSLQLREYTAPDGLTLSKRRASPPAVKKKGTSAAPSIVAGPGYEGGKAPGSTK